MKSPTVGLHPRSRGGLSDPLLVGGATVRAIVAVDTVEDLMEVTHGLVVAVQPFRDQPSS